MSIKSINPANGQIIKTYEADTDEQVLKKIEQTNAAWQKWRLTAHSERSVLLHNLAGILTKRKAELAQLMAYEMGKPVNQGASEIDKCASVCTYYANNAASFLQEQLIETDAQKSFITFQPIGVVLAIMPWNFPFWQVFRFLAPALAAGNCGVLNTHQTYQAVRW